MILTYLPAQLKNNAHGWQIEYSTLNPATGKMQRHVTKLNVLRKKYSRLADFKAHCITIVNDINARLAGGWTPSGESHNSRMVTPVAMVAESYINEKEKELRPDTLRCYKSFCKGLVKWLEKVSPGCPMGSFNRVMAVRFLDHCANDRDLHGRSWNNQLKAARAFFSWAIEKCYAKENPFASIRPKREEAKKRILVPHETRVRIIRWAECYNPGLLTVCQLLFISLIRPKEVRMIRVEDVHLDQHYIYIKGDNAKTHFSRFAALTPEIEARLRPMMEKAQPKWYLIGDGYKTGPKPTPEARFRKDWDAMRLALKLPKEMQLYSLRDTGINEMLKVGIDPLSVMQHADHHDLSMTTRYANHVDPKLVETISTKAPAF